MAAPAAFEVLEDAGAATLKLRGDWTLDTIAPLEASVRELKERLSGHARLDVAELGRLDVAGAYLITCALGEKAAQDIHGEHPSAARLLAVVRKAATSPHEEPVPRDLKWVLEKLGRYVAGIGDEIVATLSFFGHTLAVFLRLLPHPKKWRWTSIVHVMEHAGLNAMPIIAILSFFIGLVVAYLGARILGDFGASVFTVELVAFSVMREFGVVITAVLLAGRTDSAFTAEIGAMKMRQEIDAMRVMGIDPMEALVVPRLIGLLVMAPILAFAAIMAGLLGGLLVCWGELGVSPVMFLTRVSEGVPAKHFWVGMLKAPAFAVVLAIVGARHGLEVGGDVASLGKRTTISVVQAIFLVIMLDAAFAIWFLELDL